MGVCASNDKEAAQRLARAADQQRIEDSELLLLKWTTHNGSTESEASELAVRALETVEALAEHVAVVLQLREGDGRFLRVEFSEEEVLDRSKTLQDVGMCQGARFLIKGADDIDTDRARSKQYDLLDAAKCGRLEEVEAICAYCPELVKTSKKEAPGPDQQFCYETTPLSVASSGGHIAVAKALMQARADPNKQPMLYGCAPLHVANNAAMATLLLDSKASPNLESWGYGGRGGGNALYHAYKRQKHGQDDLSGLIEVLRKATAWF
eukprot:TRINITY_DN50740_c0_g1_i1.p1 TRINITY_DN50740_c0_g1~~TRINITY_DN50740_c0_g1_i1.p1  ORF type:complete len:266 (-),score=56.71 TRINITY_DN50740_c0_g1_i1:32-829(-)